MRGASLNQTGQVILEAHAHAVIGQHPRGDFFSKRDRVNVRINTVSARGVCCPHRLQGDGAFIEPRGCNRWQPVASR
jgi:hypothetical protein